MISIMFYLNILTTCPGARLRNPNHESPQRAREEPGNRILSHVDIRFVFYIMIILIILLLLL